MSANTGLTIGQVAIQAAGFVLAPYTAGVSLTVATYANLAITAGRAAYSIYQGLHETANQDETINRQESIADLRIQTSTLGQAIPQVFGGHVLPPGSVPATTGGGRLAGNIIWATPKDEHYLRSYSPGGMGGLTGGGGGPSTIVTITKFYTISMAIALCDTRVSGLMDGGIRRIWKNATLIYDASLGTPFPYNLTFYAGTADQLPDPGMEGYLGVGSVPAYRYLCYVVMGGENLGPSGQVPQYSFELGQHTGRLHTIVERLCTAAHLTGDDVDVSALEGETIVHMTLTSIAAVKAPLEQLALAYRFYGLESGRQYVFRPIGAGGIVAQIPEEALSAGEHQAEARGPQVTRATNLELPSTLYVTYVDPYQNFQRSTQPSTTVLPVSGRENPKNVSLPLALFDTQARQLAHELLVQAWVQRESVTFTLSRRYAYLEPGDHIEVTFRGMRYSLLVQETTYGAPGIVEVAAVVNASPRPALPTLTRDPRTDPDGTEMLPTDTVITGAEAALPGSPPPQDQVILAPGTTTPVFYNLPVLSSTDQVPRYHVGYQGEHEPWEGAVLYRSVDAGFTYQVIDTGTLEAYTGTVAVALPGVADWTILDTTTTFTVVLDYGDLTTLTAMANAEGVQRVMVGAEMLYVGTATLVGTRTYECSDLWRGRQGTEWAVGTHVADEAFVLLDVSIHALTMTTEERNFTRLYKAVTQGQAIEDVDEVPFTPTAENLIPWLVTDPRASRPGYDWQLRWELRSRFVPGGFDPDFIGFQVKIYSNSSYSFVVRTVETSGGNALHPTALKGWTYALQDQVNDWGAMQNVLYYTVAQVGAYAVGRVAHLTSSDLVTVQAPIDEATTVVGLTWVDVTTTALLMQSQGGYKANNAAQVVLTMPTTAGFGELILIEGYGAGGWRVALQAGQQIHAGPTSTTVGVTGYIESTHARDVIGLRCVVANLEWNLEPVQGSVVVH